MTPQGKEVLLKGSEGPFYLTIISYTTEHNRDKFTYGGKDSDVRGTVVPSSLTQKRRTGLVTNRVHGPCVNCELLTKELDLTSDFSSSNRFNVVSLSRCNITTFPRNSARSLGSGRKRYYFGSGSLPVKERTSVGR